MLFLCLEIVSHGVGLQAYRRAGRAVAKQRRRHGKRQLDFNRRRTRTTTTTKRIRNSALILHARLFGVVGHTVSRGRVEGAARIVQSATPVNDIVCFTFVRRVSSHDRCCNSRFDNRRS
jgi:hypothetical protein